MVIVNIGASAAACAVAAVVIGNPIGAAGGAIYGAVFGAVGSVTEEVGRTSSIGVKTLLVIGAVFAAWQLAELCGVTMSFGSAVVLTLASSVVLVAVALVVAAVAAAPMSMLVLGY